MSRSVETAAQEGAAFAERLFDDYRLVLLRRGWTPSERRAFFEVMARCAASFAEDEGGAWLQ